MMKTPLLSPLLLPFVVFSCSSEKKFEERLESGSKPSKDYCPYEMDAAADSSAVLSDLAGNWIYGTRMKVDEEGPFKDTYVQSGFEIRNIDSQMMDVRLRFPNLTQKSASLVETETRFSFKELKISDPIKTDDGEFRLLIFNKTDGSLGKFDCAVTAMRREKDSLGREILLVKGWEYNRSSTAGGEPQLRTADDYLKDKGTSIYFRYETTATGAFGTEENESPDPATTTTTPTGTSLPQTANQPTLENAPFNHLTILKFDPRNVERLVSIEFIAECSGKNWVVRFNEFELAKNSAKSTQGYTNDFASCEKLDITIKNDTTSPLMRTLKLQLDHRALWKLNSQGNGEILIDIQDILTKAQPQT